MSRCAIDTNIAVYAFIGEPRRDRAVAVLDLRPVISIQVLNEFSNVARRKLRRDWDWIGVAIERLILVAELIMPVTVATHMSARVVAERYKLAFYDACIVASALEARANTLFSKDMQDGLQIEELTIRNPFA